MQRDITVNEALSLPGAKLIDVRSESEFAEATIANAVNIPLLRDDERVAVGTTYKKQGEDEARELGLNFVSPRLPEMIKQYRALQDQKIPLVVFCWRGGMRSKSMCSLLEALNLPVYRLIGGYKAYRKYVNMYLERPLPHKAVVIHGLTGVGKTEILQELRNMTVSAIDLEGLANNRGSVFGQIGMMPQPSQKMFDGLLVKELAFWEPSGYIIVECESRRIGRIVLPASLVDAMRTGIRILAYSPIEKRIERIKRIYAVDLKENNNELKKAVFSLEQRVGKKRVAEIADLIDEGKLDEVVEYLLISYYDPLYKYPSDPTAEYDLCVNTSNVTKAAEEIRDFLIEKLNVVI